MIPKSLKSPSLTQRLFIALCLSLAQGQNLSAQEISTAKPSAQEASYQEQEEKFLAQLESYWQLPANIPPSIQAKKPTLEELEQVIIAQKEAKQAAKEAAKQKTGTQNKASENTPKPPPPKQISIGEFLAIGQSSLEVIFFSYSREEQDGKVDGQTKGIFASKEVIRSNQHELEIKHMEAEVLGNKPDSPSTWISVKEGTWYLPMNLLISESRTEIRRSNMRIIGEGCRYSGNDELIEIYGKTFSEFYRAAAQSTQDPLDPRSTVSITKPTSATNPASSPN